MNTLFRLFLAIFIATVLPSCFTVTVVVPAGRGMVRQPGCGPIMGGMPYYQPGPMIPYGHIGGGQGRRSYGGGFYNPNLPPIGPYGMGAHYQPTIPHGMRGGDFQRWKEGQFQQGRRPR